MTGTQIRRVIVAGGGTAGWSAAAALSHILGGLLDITLVESDEIGIVGVGESTIPTVTRFHQILDIEERDFLRATNATFKLGIAFENWGRDGDRYIHAFGEAGPSTWVAPFHHIWLQARAEGMADDLPAYSLEATAAMAGKYQAGAGLSYAYHLDAGLYGRFLRARSEAKGVRRVEGRIARVEQNAETGFITALVMESGAKVEGDLFIDCTGFRGLLIEETLKTGWIDWGHWLPTDRAVVVQTESHGPLLPYTRAIAHDAGWRWRIPLQNRVGNGLVYASRYLDDDTARERLVKAMDAPMVTEPRLIPYATGQRRRMWNKNCVALGLSSGFIEPLESTSIHLIQAGITRLAQLFPYDGISEALADRYNGMAQTELEGVRDFVILHYKLNERPEAFWRERRDSDVPDSLAERMALFAEGAVAYQTADDLFRVDSWLQVMMGQGVTPKAWHLVGKLIDRQKRTATLEGLKAEIARSVAAMPPQDAFLARYLARETA